MLLLTLKLVLAFHLETSANFNMQQPMQQVRGWINNAPAHQILTQSGNAWLG